MVSSDSGGVGGVGLADSSVGSIVWVRRRNGSWWPGKILGPDELSSTHLMSPRSGTPVKLLGREDASVDWYNLEKSKRVKAFRCGEFDECIEKAEASLGLPAKKREKYARREDAILHALELEKEFHEKKYGKSGANSSSMKNNLSDSVAKDLATSSGTPGNGIITHQNYEMQHMHSKGDLSGGNESHCDPPPAPKIRSGNWPESQNTHPSSSTALNGSHEMLVDGHGHAFGSSSDADSGNSSGRVKGLTDGCRGFNQVVRMSSNMLTHSLFNAGNYAQVKRSRALYMPSATNGLVDVKGGRPGQNDIFASHLREGSCHRHTNGFADDASSGSSENTESDSSETDSVEHAMDAEMNTFSDSKTPMDVQPLNRLEMQDHASISSEDQDPMSPGDAPHFHYHDPISLGMGISRWQLKGKRNVRSLPRKSLDMYSSRPTFLDAGGRTLSQRTNDSVSCYRDNDYNNDVEFCDGDLGPSMEGGLGNRGCVSNQQSAIRRQGFLGQNMIEMEELMVGNRYFSGYWGERNGGFSSFYVGRHGRDMLLDVDLKVEAHYRGGEHVPWVSLMSRLNGKAIIGHPIQIEKLEDGCTDSLLSTLNDFENFECDNDGNRSVPPMWRTARRTANVRVPRPHVSQPEDVDSLYLLDDLDRGPQFGRSAPGISAQKKELGKRKSPHVQKLSKKKKKKKTPKKSNLSSGQKIRPLSAIGNDQSLGSDPRGSSYTDYMDGVIKPLDSGPPTVACIPLKLVFSRLLEAVGRPPSGSTNHGVAANSNKDLDPNLHRLQQEPTMPVDGPIHNEAESD